MPAIALGLILVKPLTLFSVQPCSTFQPIACPLRSHGTVGDAIHHEVRHLTEYLQYSSDIIIAITGGDANEQGSIGDQHSPDDSGDLYQRRWRVAE